MKKIFCIATMTALSFSAMSQTEIVALWPEGQVPNAIPNTLVEKSETTGGIMRISQVTVPTLTAYLPAAGKVTGAGVMICPGGGYSILAAQHEGSELAEWFTERGIAAFVLKYRLPNEKAMTRQHEVPLMDAMQGMKIIRQHATKWGVNPSMLGVMGFSAGGHLAATLSTHFDRPPNGSELAKPNFALLLYPVITFQTPYAHGGSRDKLLGPDKSENLILYYSNETQVTSSTPPTFLVHAEDDKAVPIENSINYYLALKKNEVPSELHIYPAGGHGFALRTTGKGSVENWPQAMEGWLKSHKFMK
ncbi:alpha/beta hydrolase [Arundinibacter roseus]|uniref:Alpha/beta hydrolase n=1 Tax=Arundinibacter roseus TaxID=2070510 RepID=A0A4R4K941_9BACT|nr:alpha/beta hydrolase [Arundinibacter roseus]TDB63963.1 alpha/beta hydrolase [Arundinibacter roseus]